MSSHLIFLIESGVPLQLVKKHISDRQRVAKSVLQMAKELGVTEISQCRMTGVLRGVVFPGAIPETFTKDKKGLSHPKKGTVWAAQFNAQNGWPNNSQLISSTFKIPLSLEYFDKGSNGHVCIGNPLNECGFLYESNEGPYALWMPDVNSYVVNYERAGYQVAEPAKSFVPNIEGCRLLEKEEWDIIVAQYRLAQKQAKRTLNGE